MKSGFKNKMEIKNEISNGLIEILLKNRKHWKDLRVDDSAKNSTFIDLTLNTIKLNIEVTNKGDIVFSFDDGWSYFGGNPIDRHFNSINVAAAFLNHILNHKLTKEFIITYKGRQCQAYIEFVSSDPYRKMGNENIYEISVDDVKTGEEVVVAEVSEYPAGIFTIYKKIPEVELTEMDIQNYLQQDNDFEEEFLT